MIPMVELRYYSPPATPGGEYFKPVLQYRRQELSGYDLGSVPVYKAGEWLDVPTVYADDDIEA